MRHDFLREHTRRVRFVRVAKGMLDVCCAELRDPVYVAAFHCPLLDVRGKYLAGTVCRLQPVSCRPGELLVTLCSLSLVLGTQ